MKNCTICGKEIRVENDGELLRDVFSDAEKERIPNKGLCVDCKKEMLFAGIIRVIWSEAVQKCTAFIEDVIREKYPNGFRE